MGTLVGLAQYECASISSFSSFPPSPHVSHHRHAIFSFTITAAFAFPLPLQATTRPRHLVSTPQNYSNLLLHCRFLIQSSNHHTVDTESKMHPDRTTNMRESAEATNQSTEANPIRNEIFGRDSLPKLNYVTHTHRQLLIAHKSSEVNIKDRGENKENITGEQAATIFSNVKFSHPRTLAQLRKRHDKLAAYIQKTKEEIARHPQMVGRELAPKAENGSAKIKQEEEEEEEDDDDKMDIKLDEDGGGWRLGGLLSKARMRNHVALKSPRLG
jgi:hypothetical protein